LRKYAFLATVFAVFFLASFASAQQLDAMFGFGTVTSPGASSCGFSFSTFTGNCPESGGLYPSVGADVLFHHRFGIGFDASWRGSQGAYGGEGGQPYRPILFDINGVYSAHVAKKASVDLFGGIGWQSTRFYGFSLTSNCIYFGACYQSSNHFLVDVGAGIRYYVWGHVFVRPEVRYYNIINNTADFTSGNVLRLGGSIGYTIGGPN
jgi:hypothetical protein